MNREDDIVAKKKNVTNEEALYEFINIGKITFARIFTLWFSTFMLWTSIEVSNEFFKSVVLISIAQLLYAYSIKGKTPIRGILALFASITMMGVLAIGLAGVMGKLAILPTDLGYYIAVKNAGEIFYLFRSGSLITFMAIVFPFIYILEWGTGYTVKGG